MTFIRFSKNKWDNLLWNTNFQKNLKNFKQFYNLKLKYFSCNQSIPYFHVIQQQGKTTPKEEIPLSLQSSSQRKCINFVSLSHFFYFSTSFTLLSFLCSQTLIRNFGHVFVIMPLNIFFAFFPMKREKVLCKSWVW